MSAAGQAHTVSSAVMAPWPRALRMTCASTSVSDLHVEVVAGTAMPEKASVFLATANTVKDGSRCSRAAMSGSPKLPSVSRTAGSEGLSWAP